MTVLSYARIVPFGGIATALLTIFLVLLTAILFKALQNLYFHPLSSFPGPRLWIAFPFIQRIPQIRGQLDLQIRDLADNYDGVIRTGPNEIIFTTAKAWKNIYGHGHPELPKAPPQAAGMKNRTNILYANAKDHFRLRRAMLPAFSDRALDQQEPLIREYVDLLLEKLKEVARSGEATNMVKWYTFCTFDLIGDLAYGKSFGGLAEGKSNMWIENIEKMMRLVPLRMMASAIPLPSKAVMSMVSGRLKKSRREHIRMTTALAMQRIDNKDQEHRGDFMDFMMRSRGEEHGLTDKELASNANTIIVAGSETTATLLCGVTYYLLSTPETYRKCVDEVRSAFVSDEEITFRAASARLPYMLSCLNEALRLFPPVPTAMFRRTLPDQMTEIDGHLIPGNTLVGIHHLATYHSEKNFHRARSFHPERWTSEAQINSKSPFFNDDREALNPFSTGPRDCIGRNLAYHEMRLILAKVLWNLDFELIETCQEWAESRRTFMLWEKSPLMVTIKEREM